MVDAAESGEACDAGRPEGVRSTRDVAAVGVPCHRVPCLPRLRPDHPQLLRQGARVVGHLGGEDGVVVARPHDGGHRSRHPPRLPARRESERSELGGVHCAVEPDPGGCGTEPAALGQCRPHRVGRDALGEHHHQLPTRGQPHPGAAMRGEGLPAGGRGECGEPGGLEALALGDRHHASTPPGIPVTPGRGVPAADGGRRRVHGIGGRPPAGRCCYPGRAALAGSGRRSRA